MKWLQKWVNNKPFELKERGLYACTAGERIGNFYLNYKTDPITLATTFIILPDFNTATLSLSTINLGLSSGVLDFVQVFKPIVFETVVKEFEGRQNYDASTTRDN